MVKLKSQIPHTEMRDKWKTFIKWFSNRPTILGLLIFVLCLSGTFYVSMIRQSVLKENEENKMNIILKDIHQNIEKSLRESYLSTFELGLTINDEGVPEHFETISKEIIADNPLINSVQLAPNGVIKYIYPLKGNEKALDLNLLQSASLRNHDFVSGKNKKIHFDGPFNLKQGGVGVIIRLPVYKRDAFWGFISLVVKFEDLLKVSKIDRVNPDQYHFQFSTINPVTYQERFFLPYNVIPEKDHYVTYMMPNSEWKLYLITNHASLMYPLTLFTLVVGIILSIIISILTVLMLKKPEELQLLVDAQLADIVNKKLKFKAFFQQATIGFIIVDANTGNFLDVNSKYCQMLGYTEGEIMEKNFAFFTHPDDVSTSIENLEKLKSGVIKEYTDEKRYITKSGEIIWVSVSVSPLWESDKKTTSNIAFIKDITLKKEANALIEKSEIRFKSLFENSLLPLWEEDFSGVKNRLAELDLMNKDPELVYSFFDEHPEEIINCISLVKIINVNYECLKLHKVKSKEELITNLNKLIDVSAIDTVKRQLVAIAQNAKQFNIDSRIKNNYGEYRDIHLRWSVIKGHEETYERVILSTEDVTERKATEKIIVDSQEKIESIINSIDGIVWEYDLESEKLTFVSEKVNEILGYSVKEYIDTPFLWENKIHPDDKEWVLNFNIASDKKKQSRVIEYRMITKNGETIWIRDIVNVVLRNKEMTGLRGIMIDITNMKEAEEDLNNSLYLVTEQNKRLLNFSYIVSHNLRSHTSNIKSIVSLVETEETEEERHEMMKLLKSVSNSLDETMDHLNDVINVNTNINLVTKPLVLHQYIETVKAVLTEQIQLTQATITSDIPEDLMVNYNPAYLQSILYNLISNAIRYRHPDREPIISLKWRKEDNQNVLEITDNGIGIDLVKNGDKIFGMYKTFSSNVDSKGIGLFITRNQIEAMGGSITVASEPCVGTTFKIYIK